MFIDFLYDALSTQLEVFGVVNLSIWVLITSAYIQIVSFYYFSNIWLGTWYYSKMAKINIDINLDTFFTAITTYGISYEIGLCLFKIEVLIIYNRIILKQSVRYLRCDTNVIFLTVVGWL